MNGALLDRFQDRALAGLPLLGTPRHRAERHRRRFGFDRDAAGALLPGYVGLAGAAGFLCGVPGYGAMPVTVPANVAGVLVLHLHLAATVAALSGADPADPEVRRRCRECLGSGKGDPGEADGGAGETGGGTEASDGGAPPLPGRLGLRRLKTKLGERGLRLAAEWMPLLRHGAGRRSARNLPLLGGAIGAVADGGQTTLVGSRAIRAFFDA